MRNVCCLLVLLSLRPGVRAQSYQSFFTGNTTDVTTQGEFGILLAGGGRDNDNAMRWMLDRADGGDVLILRASGSNGYNEYLKSELGRRPNSVETILFRGRAAASDPYILRRIAEAEMIFFAGGNQTRYVDLWRDTEVQQALQRAVDERRVVIGGTSAGMAILGGHVYAPRNDGITSLQAVSNPFHPNLEGLTTEPFLRLPYLANTVTDTHFDDRNRRGRTLVFLARTQGQGITRAIAANEETAVAIDANGTAKIFGTDAESFVYFLQTGCPDGQSRPETLTKGQPLTWINDRRAVAAYRLDGNRNGTRTFALTDWKAATDGTWVDWYVDNGRFQSNEPGTPPSTCQTTGLPIEWRTPDLRFGPSPTRGIFYLTGLPAVPTRLELLDANGRTVAAYPQDQLRFDFSARRPGLYYLRLTHPDGRKLIRFVKR